MRRILVDAARRKQTLKRGGDRQSQHVDDIEAPEIGEDLLALDEAMEKLAAHDPIKAKLIELRYFAGLTGEQAAEILGISPTTADRYWTYARAWLHARIQGK
jgi:RNA polymerase sigma factor (TIGR02999 family)